MVVARRLFLANELLAGMFVVGGLGGLTWILIFIRMTVGVLE